MQEITVFQTFDGVQHQTLNDARKHLVRLEDKANCKVLHLIMDLRYRDAVELIDNQLDDLYETVKYAKAVRDDKNQAYDNIKELE